VPVSLPFFSPSVQVGVLQIPPRHTPLAQSEPSAQALSSAQGTQAGPPQSVSVSAAFFTPSLQVGASQVPPPHNPL
jgi:hypothetical protein